MMALLSGVPLAATAVLGAMAGLGLRIALLGLSAPERRIVDVRHLRKRCTARNLGTLALSGLAGGAAWAVTRWPVIGVAAAGAVLVLPGTLERRGAAMRDIAKVEAIATWTEQLRDNLAAAGGLQSALAAAAEAPPAAIAGPVERLAARLDYERIPVALRRFGAEVGHPAADFVVAALLIATEHRSRHLGPLLGRLATTARDEAALRRRIWVSRARARTSVKVVSLIVPGMIGALILVDRRYLSAYDGPRGQLVLCVVLGVFVAAFVAMNRMSRLSMPERFLARTSEGDRP